MSTILQNHYVLAVPNVRGSAKFYVEVLGFSVCGEPPGWIFVKRDNCMIMLGECPGELPAAELGSHSYFAYLRVDNVDEYYDRLREKDADFCSPLRDKPWRMREFGIKTPDGHRIMIGQIISGPPAT